MFWEAVCNNLGTIVGTAGSIFGVFLGWWLNNWSKRGKLNIYLSEWKDQFKRNQFGVSGNSPSKAEAESYHFYCSLDLHNSSSEAKIMRDFKIVYRNKYKELWADYPLDDSTTVRTSVGYSSDDLCVVNIPPKSVVKINFHNSLHSKETLSVLWDTISIFLEYKDENNKKKVKLLKVENFNEYDFTQGAK